MQHCAHVAAYYWHLYSTLGTLVYTATERNGFHAKCVDYGLAAKDALHARKWFRY